MCRAAALALLGASLLSARRATASTSVSVFCPVLVMHHVKPLYPSDDAIERGLTLLPSQFDADMRYLMRNKYHTVTSATLSLVLRGAARLPPRPVVLTFDDGYSDVYPNVFKLLLRNRMVATFFIVPELVGTRRYLTWRQIEDMARHGMDIEAHSLTHPDLTTVHGAVLWHEIWGSRRILQQRLHRPVRVFAYPYGAFDAAVLRDVNAAGFWAAFTTQQGWRMAGSAALTLPRVYIDLDDTTAIFAGRLRADARTLALDPT